MEILVSSLRPFQMMLGKILGVGLTGLLQLSIWVGSIFLLTHERAHLAGLLHVTPEAMQQLPIPSMPADLLVVFLLYFILGFLLYGSLYAAVGSMFNTPQEAQQVAMFVQMAIMFGWSLTSVPVFEVVISLGLSVLGLLAVAWLAGRIYRTGILMYGKKPSLGEVFRWVAR
jgi:ABC-2 type transport system permease protein